MRSGIHFVCGRIRRAAPRGPAQIPAPILPFASPAGCGSALSLGAQPAGIIRTKLADRPSGKCRPALSHSKVQLPRFDDLPNCSALRARIAPLFSHTYKNIFPQMFSFDILTKRRGVTPSTQQRGQIYPPCKAQSLYVSYSCALFCTPQNFNSPAFNYLRALSQKHPGGVPLIPKKSRKRVRARPQSWRTARRTIHVTKRAGID